MFLVAQKVAYDGEDRSVFGIAPGQEGFITDEKPWMEDGSTVVVEFTSSYSGNPLRQEVEVSHLTLVD